MIYVKMCPFDIDGVNRQCNVFGGRGVFGNWMWNIFSYNTSQNYSWGNFKTLI